MFTIALLAALQMGQPSLLMEQIDLYAPTSGAFLGRETTWYGPDGRRLRLEIVDGAGEPTLLFFVRHDAEGRESEAFYFEGGPDASREAFTYSDDGRMRTTTYFSDDGQPGERTESDLNADGREVFKRYYRADGVLYGEEDVLWNPEGDQLGWAFRYLLREGSVEFSYAYEDFDGRGSWTRRVRSRDGVPERLELRQIVYR